MKIPLNRADTSRMGPKVKPLALRTAVLVRHMLTAARPTIATSRT